VIIFKMVIILILCWVLKATKEEKEWKH